MEIDLDFLARRTPEVVGEQEMSHFAVVIPLRETPEGWKLLFEVRSEKLAHQPGDICFPGGRVEPGESPEEAALREICEELLVSPEQLKIIGPADIFKGGSWLVHPFVCVLKDYDGRFGDDEVAEVFDVPLRFFVENDPEIHTVKWIPQFAPDFPFEKIHGGRDYPWRTPRDQILFYEYDGRVIWGITAKIIESFVRLFRDLPELPHSADNDTINGL